MDNQAGLGVPKMQIEGLVRDRNGRPKIDGDPQDLPDSVKAAMTQDELKQAQQEFNNV